MGVIIKVISENTQPGRITPSPGTIFFETRRTQQLHSKKTLNTPSTTIVVTTPSSEGCEAIHNKRILFALGFPVYGSVGSLARAARTLRRRTTIPLWSNDNSCSFCPSSKRAQPSIPILYMFCCPAHVEGESHKTSAFEFLNFTTMSSASKYSSTSSGGRSNDSVHSNLLRESKEDVFKKYETLEVLGQGSMVRRVLLFWGGGGSELPERTTAAHCSLVYAWQYCFRDMCPRCASKATSWVVPPFNPRSMDLFLAYKVYFGRNLSTITHWKGDEPLPFMH